MVFFKNNIKTKTITKTYKVMDEVCSIVLENAYYKESGGKELLLDDTLVNKTFSEIINAVSINSSKYNPIPHKIIIRNKSYEKKDHGEDEKTGKESLKEEFIESSKPRWTMDEVFIDENSKKQIITALTMAKYKDKLFNEWGLKGSVKTGRAVAFNFWGPPGTGKSMTAEAIASFLNKDVFSVNYSELESKYVGETPKNIKRAFQKAKESNAVLIFDEADSFLGKRLTNVSQSADYGVNITRSVMLLELEKFDGVVIFTTNLISNYDEAFKRRILANIEFKLPDRRGRESIWDVHIPESLPLDQAITCAYLANKYEGISGADIRDIVLYAATMCLQEQRDSLNVHHFDEAYNYVINRYGDLSNIKKVTTERISEEQFKKEMEGI